MRVCLGEKEEDLLERVETSPFVLGSSPSFCRTLAHTPSAEVTEANPEEYADAVFNSHSARDRY